MAFCVVFHVCDMLQNLSLPVLYCEDEDNNIQTTDPWEPVNVNVNCQISKPVSGI